MHREDPRLSLPALFDRIHRLRARPFRDRTGLHFVEGLRAVLWALEAHVPVETLLYSEVLCWAPAAQKRVRLAKRAGIQVMRLTPEEFRSISTTPRASGLGAIVRQHWTRLEDIDPRRGLCRVAVGRIRSPGNLGTILRTAEAVGAAGAIILGPSSDPFDPAVTRATMGGIFRLELVRATHEEFGAWCRLHGCRVLGTSPTGRTVYSEATVEAPLVLLLGEERQGMTAVEAALCTDTARIPIAGRSDSLNVGVAAGIMLYEVLRRR